MERVQGKYRIAVAIKYKARGLQLARQLTLQNMQHKIRALRSWNRPVWAGQKGKAHLLKLLNKLLKTPLSPAGLEHLYKTMEAGLSHLAVGILDDATRPPVEKPLPHTVPEAVAKNNKGEKFHPHLTLEKTVHWMETRFPHTTHTNGDVDVTVCRELRLGKLQCNKSSFTGPELDAVRDVTAHWEFLYRIWSRTHHSKPLDPFAAEFLAERISEFILFYLRRHKTNKTTKTLTPVELDKITQDLLKTVIIRKTPHRFLWENKMWQTKKKVLARLSSSPLFAEISLQKSGIHTTPCDAWTAQLYKGKYAFTRFFEGYKLSKSHYISQLVDRRPIAQKHAKSNAPNTMYPGISIVNGAGIAVGDYDNDGKPDLYFAGEGCNRLYRNLGNYRFKDVTQQVGLSNPNYDSSHPIFADINNDGRLDLLVLHKVKPSRLYLQQANGKFKDITKNAGLPQMRGASTAAFLDYDNDGLLDLYIGYFGTSLLKDQQMPSIDGRNGRPNQLLRNLGQGRFQNVTKSSGLGTTAWTLAIAAIDINQDGHIDLFLANDFGSGQMFLNRGNGTFQEVTRRWGVEKRNNGMNVSYTDINNDGRWDFYISSVDTFNKELRFFLPRSKDPVNVDEHILRSSFYLEGNMFYVSAPNNKDFYHSLEQKHFEPGEKGWAWGAVFFDYDNDGDEDFYLTNGFLSKAVIPAQKNQMFVRQGQHFFLYNKPSPVSYLGLSRAVAAVDLTGTGRMDLVLNDIGVGPKEKRKFHVGPKLFRNQYKQKNNWLKVKLRGVKNNYFGVGASIRLEVKGLPTQQRQVSAGSNYLTQDPTTVTIGLGQAKHADKIIVRWPGGKKQIVRGPLPARKTVVVREQ